jgi:GntR family transcriptional regulator/MocR family aminotransferase
MDDPFGVGLTEVPIVDTRLENMRIGDGLIPVVPLDPSGRNPLYAQLYEGLRESIRSRRLMPGSRLPSTRSLAEDLGVSRTTTVEAYRQLEMEGYVESNRGSGTYVARELPDAVTCAEGFPDASGRPSQGKRPLSERGRRLARLAEEAFVDTGTSPFLPGIPALDLFPWKAWRRAEHRVLVTSRPELGPGDPAGQSVLRNAIATHLRGARALACTAEQVVITSDAQEAFAVLADLLLDPGDAVLMEDPGYTAVSRLFEASGARIVPVSVDGDGLDVAQGIETAPRARLAYLTPSNQFPLGGTLSRERREALVEWAYASGAWIVEDDYDSEYRFEGPPLPAIRSLPAAGSCTVYVGTFAKILCPAVSLGFVVLPDELVGPFAALRALRASPIHVVPQLTIAMFIEEGGLARHIRRMRVAYVERAQALQHAIELLLPDILQPVRPSAGMHLIAWLENGVEDARVSRRAALNGVHAPALSFFRRRPGGRRGLVLGFGNVAVDDMERWVARLTKALRQ